jgi:hypothetical protein
VRRLVLVLAGLLLLAAPAAAQVEVWTNNAGTTLQTAIGTGDLAVVVPAGQGALFPALAGGNYFWLTLEEGSTREIMKVTARASDTLTVVRAQQGTTAQSFTTAAKVQQRLTKQTLVDLQRLLLEVSIDLSTDGRSTETVTVTGLSWITASSHLVCSPFATTADGQTIENYIVAAFAIVVSNLSVGAGFDLSVFSPFGAAGLFRFHCIGA